MNTLKQRLLGAAVTLSLVAFTIGVPLLLVRFDLGPTEIAADPVWSNLGGRDDGTLAVVVLGAIAWTIWAVLVYLLAIETIAAVRHAHAPQIHGLTAPQHGARTLITWAALLFVAAPGTGAITLVPSAAPAEAMPAIAVAAPLHSETGGARAVAYAPRTAAHPIQGLHTSAHTASTKPPVRAHDASDEDLGTTRHYTVKRGDSLWKIAQTQLGDPLRYTEMADLNAEILGGRPDFITPGTRLRLPSDARTTDENTSDHGSDRESEGNDYVVRPGDTLSGIAQNHLDDPTRYIEIFDASTFITQPGGAHLRDPDLIKPGWTLELPHQQNAGQAASRVTTKHPATPDSDPRRAAPDRDTASNPAEAALTPSPAHLSTEPLPVQSSAAIAPTTASPTAPAAAVSSASAHPGTGTTPDVSSSSNPWWLLAGLTGAGAMLSAAVWLVVRARRRTQLRYREPGQFLAPPPEELRAVDRTTQVTGSPTAARVEALDGLLRDLGTNYEGFRDLPNLVAVELSDADVTLHLAEDATLEAPWHGAGRVWTAPLDVTAPRDELAPYPLLVTVGQADDGHVWLLNLEHAGALTLTGNADRAAALARYIAAELVFNPWSTSVTVHASGVAEELRDVDLIRFAFAEADDPTTLDELRRAVSPAVGLRTYDPETFHVLITTARLQADGIPDLARAIGDHPTRSGVAIVALSTTGIAGAPIMQITDQGHLHVPDFALDVVAVGLSSVEAQDCASLAVASDTTTCIPYPPAMHSTPGDDPLTDTAGALLVDLVADRPTDPGEPAGPTSLLPLAAQEYADAAPATVEDIATLAPRIPEETARRTLDAYPTLDADVADWFRGADCSRPRLAVLGPVKAWGKGDPRAAARRKPFLTGVLGLLALHPSGVTTDELRSVAGAASYRNIISELRHWMGPNMRTGHDFVPGATETRAAIAHGEPRYQVDDVLVDYDLFMALRARGQARSAAGSGIEDLRLALQLVRGAPFSQLHPRAWIWLDETDRPDLAAPAAVVDVAHTLLIAALAAGDTHTARDAAIAAVMAAPYDEIAQLDRIAAVHAEGEHSRAAQLLQLQVLDRNDDHRSPVVLPPRSEGLLSDFPNDAAKSPRVRD